MFEKQVVRLTCHQIPSWRFKAVLQTIWHVKNHHILAVVMLMLLLFVLPTLALAQEPVSQSYTLLIAPQQPDRIVIPTINLDSDIAAVGSYIRELNGQKYREWQTADRTVGWHNRSAWLGDVGNTVLTGHSDIFNQVFQNLYQIKSGDVIIVYSDRRSKRYVVSEVREVREKGVSLAQRIENGRLISRTIDERLTLVTCSRASASHRIIVIAHPMK